ncbi:DUF3797 domain-containing protein [Clostridium haemolyticum]|uniref:DUF3797 domain-containing protein n=1 Tax=Clostridium haemolyticum NCTC 9693 TaxID=1443114 RepID=A0ABR4TGZ9_CLOHA|nr:DUF3797 domain-containing protein [Clostridium haemolyticum]KEI18258.1 hypothetical protein Z960_03830 [Clostridium haemolyticum NCTC 9693]KGN04181.1 hypothetical protein Z961_04320 [Clostridium haemolyticum NCTC 8350]
MEAFKVVSLIRKYEKCPVCGSYKVGDIEGKILIDGDIFKRSCKCGFEITLDSDGKEIKEYEKGNVYE